MSLLFADIFEAIRYLRLCKGTTEKGILSYVQERTGGCLSPGQILKTFRALQKLVDEGVLVKNGKRYTFPTKPKFPDNDDDEDEEEKDCDEGKNEKKEEEEEEEEEESEDDDDDDDEEEEEEDEEDDEGEAECNACPKPDDGNGKDDEKKGEGDEEEEEEEDEDDDDADDDDEEEDDDDEDDDDGEACDPTEIISNKEDNALKATEAVRSEDKVAKAISSNKNPLGDGKNSGSAKTNEKKEGKADVNPCSNSKQNIRKMGMAQNGVRKSETGKTGYGKTEIGKYDGGKEVIDRGEAKRNGNKKNKKNKLKSNNEQKSTGDEKSKTVTNVINEIEKMKRRSPSKNRDYTSEGRKSRSRKNRPKNTKFHTGSPMKKAKAALYALNMDHPLDFGSFSNSSQLCPETTATESNFLENGIEDTGMDYDVFRHRSPAGPPPPNTPGVHLDKKESCCSEIDKYLTEDVKMQSIFEKGPEYSLTQKAESKDSVMSIRENRSQRFGDSKDKCQEQKLKRDLPVDMDKLGITGVAAKSLCSVCKKKRIS